MSRSPSARSIEDRFASVRRVVDAVLYEGYVLYPYRASAAKNQLRWQFGVVAPREYSESTGAEAWEMRAECLLQPGAGAQLWVRVRFLQAQRRSVERRDAGSFVPVAALDTGEEIHSTWDEAVEHELAIGPLAVGDLGEPHVTVLSLGGGQEHEPLLGPDKAELGRLVRQRWAVDGRVVVTALPAASGGLTRLGVSIENLTPWSGGGDTRDEIVRRSLISTHVGLVAEGGSFVSLIDPPEEAREAAGQCVNRGCFPVLAGAEGERDAVLASPIILYDHPQIAPESQWDMYDSTEIDEILALRVLTLTDEEKREARGTDGRAAAIIDQVEAMTRDSLARLHGTVRPVDSADADAAGAEERPWWDPGVDSSVDPATDTVLVGSRRVGKGTRVTLRPSRRADAQDLFLVGRVAVVSGVFHDVDGDVHVAVTLEDDPASEFNEWYGRYRYFSADELEVIEVSP